MAFSIGAHRLRHKGQPVALIALLFSVTSANARCSDHWICINEVREGGNVELRADNLRDFPVTFTLKVRTRDMLPEHPEVLTETLAPNESRQVMVLHPSQNGQQGHYRLYFDWTVGNLDAIHDDSQVYRLPYAAGESHRVLQGYGSRFSHTGLEQYAVDFKMPVGTAVHAARAGIVARVEESHSKGCWDDGCGNYANYIVILHDDGTTGEYYHLQRDGAFVLPGDRVAAGQKIGLSGNTGHTTMPHLHFAVYRAAEWGTTQSIPVRFASADGIVDTPRRGGRYQAE